MRRSKGFDLFLSVNWFWTPSQDATTLAGTCHNCRWCVPYKQVHFQLPNFGKIPTHNLGFTEKLGVILYASEWPVACNSAMSQGLLAYVLWIFTCWWVSGLTTILFYMCLYISRRLGLFPYVYFHSNSKRQISTGKFRDLLYSDLHTATFLLFVREYELPAFTGRGATRNKYRSF